MKKLSFQVTMVVTLIVILSIFGCKKENDVTLDEAQKTEITDTIMKLTNKLFEAGRNLDFDKMYNHFSDNTITIENGKIGYSWENQKKKTAEMLPNIEEYKLTIDKMSVDVLSPNIAILYGNYSFALSIKSGNVIKGKNALTWVFNKEKKLWKVRHVHISAPPAPQPKTEDE